MSGVGGAPPPSSAPSATGADNLLALAAFVASPDAQQRLRDLQAAEQNHNLAADRAAAAFAALNDASQKHEAAVAKHARHVAETDARHRDMASRLTAQQTAIEAREGAAKIREDNLARAMREFTDAQTTNLAALVTRERAADAMAQQLANREAAVAQREATLTRRLARTQAILQDEGAG